MMKNIKLIKFSRTFILALIAIIAFGCDRDIADDAPEATFSTLGDIYTDGPIGLGTNFYFPYADSNLDAADFNGTDTFEGDASLRIDVPNENNPNGNYAGAIFRVDGSGRDLRGYDALTFYAKASQGVSLDGVGFGEDFIDNKYQTTLTNVSLGTAWAKYIVPIPDASKLEEVRGLLRYAAGTQNTNGAGYTIWFDEIKFENLGTLAQAQPKIFNGTDIEQQGFINVPITISGLSQTFNGPSGQNLTVETTPAYFDFSSSNEDVATVDENGVISVIANGTATISASIAGVAAQGSITLNVEGTFDFAPVPPARDPSDVISIFSNAYSDVSVDYYNGFFNPDGQTTEGGAPPLNINGDDIINYTSLNFVGIGTFLNVSPVNVTGMTHLHIDIKPNEAVNPGDFINIQLLNDVGGNESSGVVQFNDSNFEQDVWATLDIPIADFGLADVSQIGLLFFISNATISDIFVDNIYYYRE